MQDSQIEEIKNKLNVVDVVGSYIKLTKTGINYRGPCPFHSEKKPSFFVSPNRQMWKCFGCGKVGDIYEFVKEIEGVEFGDALRILAAKAGVELKRENPKLRTERQRLYEICDLACSFFEKQLDASVVGKEAKEYLLKRGISEESIKKWRLGYSPDTWQSLSDFLVGKGYQRQEIIKAGLAIEKDGNRSDSYDRFRGRIAFPIFDLNSQVVGFGARVFKTANEKETAKYINTPQTFVYNKSAILYGLNFAKLPVKKENNCVITEGYTDAIMAHQAGFINTVAASGTALTSQHLEILKRYAENLILAFDMDLAGDTATKRGINLAEAQGFNIKIVDSYSGAKDPAEIILENPKNWSDLIEKARTIMDYYFDSAFEKFDENIPEGKKQIGRMILPAIKRIQNRIEQSHWIQKLSEKLGVKEDAVLQELSSLRGDDSRRGNLDSRFRGNDNGEIASSRLGGTRNDASTRKKLIEEKIISLIAKDPENLNLIEESYFPLFGEKTKSFLENLKNLAKNQPEAEVVLTDTNGLDAIPKNYKDDFKNFLATLSLRAEIEFAEDGCQEIQLCLLRLKDINTREKLSRISNEIKKAEETGDNKKVSELMGNFNKLTKEL